MTPVPASHTQAGAILTLAMPFTSEITLLALALSTLPAVLTDAGSILTAAVLATVEAAQSDATVLAGPARFTGTGVCRRVQNAVGRAAGEALLCCWVNLRALCSHPSLGADALAGDTESMARAQGVRAVSLVTKLSLISLHAHALAILTVAMA